VRLAIVDLAFGNIGSIGAAFERLGVEPEVTDDAEAIRSADRVVLPGVGAAGHAMAQIEARGLLGPLRELKQPVLGICLGMQLLFEHSDEENTPCLGIIDGRVRKLEAAQDRPVPHMGWSRLEVRDEGIGLRSGDYAYFAHSFAGEAGPASVATVDYGATVPAVVRKGNYWGAQFHPERSGAAGARFLGAFLGQ
jgi:glutamine amidotransferase